MIENTTYNRPFGRLIKTQKNNYYYDVNTNNIISISDKLYCCLTELLFSNTNEVDISQEAYQEYEKFQKLGLINFERPREIEMPETDMLPYFLENRLSGITLQVTQQCNFRCSYCKYTYSDDTKNHSHKNQKMTWETAKKAMDFLAMRVRDSAKINIGFYGGEPLMNYSLIKKCISYGNDIFSDKKVTYSMTTNGSLLTKENVKYLIDNNVKITVSLDGPKEIHDRNRKNARTGEGTFDTVHNKLLSLLQNMPEYYSKIRFNSVIDPINDGKQINDFFTDELFENNAVHTPLVEMHGRGRLFFSEKYIKEYNKDVLLILLVKSGFFDPSCLTKIAYSNYDLLCKFEKKYMNIQGLPHLVGAGGTCKPGVLKLFVTVDEKLFPCEKANDCSNVLQIGTLSSGFELDKVKQLYNMNGLIKERCKNCWAILLCSICPIRIENEEGLSKELLTSECVAEKRIIERYLKYLLLIEEGKIALKEYGKHGK